MTLIRTGAVNDPNLHIIVDGAALHIVRRVGSSARDFQNEYPDFKTSLGPFDNDQLIDTMELEWPDTLLINRFRVMEFLDGTDAAMTLE
jgi:hypothetical protein